MSFVRVYLLPDERRHQETKAKRRQANPVFNESLTFDVRGAAMNERIVKIVIIDNDQAKRHLPIGAVHFPMSDYQRCKQPRLTLWRDLKRDSQSVPYKSADAVPILSRST